MNESEKEQWLTTIRKAKECVGLKMIKKNNIKKVIASAIAISILVGGGVYFGVTKKNYKSFSDSFKKMEISREAQDENIEKLEKFAKKKGYSFSETEKSNKLVVLVVSKDYVQNLMYNPEENRLNYRKMGSADISDSQKKKIATIEVADSFEKVISKLGEPDRMEKDNTGMVTFEWGSVSNYSRIVMEDNIVTEIKQE